MKKLAFLIFLLTLGLAACNGQAPTAAPSLAILTITPHAKRTPISTPSAPPPKTVTLEHQFLTEKAYTLAQMRKQAATDDFFYSFCGNGLFPDRGYSHSAVKEIEVDWAEIECRTDDWSERYAKFVYKHGEKIWTISLDDKDVFALNNKFDISLSVNKWAKNGKYVYLYPSYHLRNGSIDEWGAYAIFHYQTGFYRLNIETGKFEALLNPNSISGHSFSYALSPDEKYLAFANEVEKNVLYIRDMNTGFDKKFELNTNIENIGDFVWTLDSNKVIFVGALNGWYDNKAGTSLYIFDAQTSALDVLLYNDSQQRVPVFNWSIQNGLWIDKNTLDLIPAQDGYPDWFIDIRTSFIALVPTQTPLPKRTPTRTLTP